MKRIIILLTLTTTGCGAHATAQRLAQENLIQVVEYRTALTKMSTHVTNYYVQTRAALEDELRAKRALGVDADLSAAASMLVDESVTDGFTEQAYEQFLMDVVDHRLASEQELRAQLQQLESQTAAATELIETKQKQLEAIEVKLEQLQKPRRGSDVIDDLAPILESVERAIEDVKSKQADQGAGQ